MEITVIKRGYNIEQVFFGKPSNQMEEWVEQLNNNPLNSERYSIEEKYTQKSIYEIVNFLEIE